MQTDARSLVVYACVFPTRMADLGPSRAPDPQKVELKMIARRIAVAIVTAALSLGIVAVSAPAQRQGHQLGSELPVAAARREVTQCPAVPMPPPREF